MKLISTCIFKQHTGKWTKGGTFELDGIGKIELSDVCSDEMIEKLIAHMEELGKQKLHLVGLK